jgi:hypothetical protein
MLQPKGEHGNELERNYHPGGMGRHLAFSFISRLLSGEFPILMKLSYTSIQANIKKSELLVLPQFHKSGLTICLDG